MDGRNPAFAERRSPEIEIIDIAPNLKLLNPQPPIPGYGMFICSYLLLGANKVLVDPGPSAAVPGLFTALDAAGVGPDEIDYIVLTHIHMDHAGGTGAAIKKMPHAAVIAHSRAIPHLVDPERLWNASLKTLGQLALKYGQIEPVPESRITAAGDRMKIDPGGLDLEILLTPGHAIHHLSIFERANRILIAGEAAGVCIDGAVRPATPPPFKLEETLASVDRLIELAPAKLCYGHFGCCDGGLERLKLYREKLITWHGIINAEAAKGKNAAEILAVLTEKDRDLGYLEKMDRDEYAREYTLLLNTINGMAGISL
ncbi:MAG: MBL fold metallo-hydrolase [Dehalococcoidia bacterium]|nr:MBL fold metallo-hydrolase [Dehalococcoidia bacterium]MDD5494333.1 MBL fold metallo-hydrolase [Dehalococcoidia bacterium]